MSLPQATDQPSLQGVLPSTPSPDPDHRLFHPEVGLHPEFIHGAPQTGGGPCGGHHQVGASED